MLEATARDIRYAFRGLRRTPGFAAVAVLTLALGVGLTTAVFSVFNAVVLRPVAYPDPERLVAISTVGPEGDSPIVIAPDFADWREQATSFDAMVAYGNNDQTFVTNDGASRVREAAVSEDFWQMTGATPIAGRLPRSGETTAIVLSHGFAVRHFSVPAEAIGRTATLGREPVTIIGVMPARYRFHFPRFAWQGFRSKDVDIYRPVTFSAERAGMVELVQVVGRLREGVALPTAHAELDAIRTRIAKTHPDPFGTPGSLRLVPLDRKLMGDARIGLQVMLLAVAFVLLIACANNANLLLARATARRKEIAIRLSVGAGRAQVLRLLLIESLVLAVLGGAAGLALARVGVATILRINPHAVPRLSEATIDGPVLAVTVAVSALAMLFFGLAPAWSLRSVAAAEMSAARPTATRPGDTRLRQLLVASEVALALVVLTGAGLLLRSVTRLQAYPPGFVPGQVLTMKIEFSGSQRSEPAQRIDFAGALLDRLAVEPGVEAASISTHGYALSRGLTLEGAPPRSHEELSREAPIMINSTTSSLPQVMGLTMVRGRWFRDGEAAVVLNESLARREFGDADAIGRRIQIGDEEAWLPIVGIVADLKYSKLDAPAAPELYISYLHGGGMFGHYALVRTHGDPLPMANRVRAVVAEVDRSLVADELMTLEQLLTDSIAPRRLNLFLLGTFAISALVLGAIGIYGVVSYAVVRRRHEIGVRTALGARRVDVARMIVGEHMRVALAGVGAGLIGAWAVTRLMAGLLYEVQPTDPPTFLVVAAVLIGTALLACLVPAVKAAGGDPVETLRTE